LSPPPPLNKNAQKDKNELKNSKKAQKSLKIAGVVYALKFFLMPSLGEDCPLAKLRVA
jgi:hypothetical protein